MGQLCLEDEIEIQLNEDFINIHLKGIRLLKREYANAVMRGNVNLSKKIEEKIAREKTEISKLENNIRQLGGLK